MTIENLIDRNFSSVSVLEEMAQIAIWLKESAYLAIVDEDLCTIGILVRDDVRRHPRHLVIDCDFRKPAAAPHQSLAEVSLLMQKVKMKYLPVFSGKDFLGVVSLSDIKAASVPHAAKLA